MLSAEQYIALAQSYCLTRPQASINNILCRLRPLEVLRDEAYRVSGNSASLPPPSPLGVLRKLIA